MKDRDLGDGLYNKAIADWLGSKSGIAGIEPPTGYVIKPESFQKGLFPHKGILVKEDGQEAFLLTDRPFRHFINRFFQHIPKDAIEFFIRQGREVVVVDLGGGADGDTGNDIAETYPQISVVNIDLVAKPYRAGNFESVRGDICELRLPDKFADVVLSHQVLPFFFEDEGLQKHRRALGEVARILKPGGIATIDDEVYSREGYGSPVLEELQRGLGLSISIRRKSYGGNFLILGQLPERLEQNEVAA